VHQRPTVGATAERFVRGGHIVKGVVHALIGFVAFRAARSGGRPEGAQGAINELEKFHPVGKELILVTGIGLAVYALWRLAVALFDLEHSGKRAFAVLKRVGLAVSAGSYALMAAYALKVGLGGRASGGGDDERPQQLTAYALATPLGQWLVAIAGLIFIGIGISQMVRALKCSFMKKYVAGEMSTRVRTAARWVGRVGIASRALSFFLIGGFLLKAAWYANAREARGLGGTFRALAATDHGPILLAVVAIGFFAYGLYCFANARWRHFNVPGAWS
jgi:hypothetical protein